MDTPLQVSYRGFEPDPDLDALIAEHVAKLERFHPHLVSCRIVVELPHRQQQRTPRYHVRIDMAVPGNEIVVSHDHTEEEALRDVRRAVHDAFVDAKRRLQDHAAHLRAG